MLIKALDEKMAQLENQAITLAEMEAELAELKAQREKLYALLIRLEEKMAAEELTVAPVPETEEDLQTR
ncbi:MAG: hypothetical protein JKY56_16940 [Kofleriaceae bacterium]|nr:hypothetical protein [Kofleriaceae bacterium]